MYAVLGHTCDGEVRESLLGGGDRADVLLDRPDGLQPQHQHLPALADAVRTRLGLQVDLRVRASLLRASARLSDDHAWLRRFCLSSDPVPVR